MGASIRDRRRINATRSQPRLSAGYGAAGRHPRHHRRGGGARRRIASCCWRCPSQSMRANLAPWAALIARRRHPGQPGQGHRTGHADADEPGHRGRSPAPTRPGRGDLRAEPGQRDRRRATRRHRGRLHRLRPRGRAAARADTGYFRPYTNADVVGTEIGGACKNVIALACGMAAGMGLGENTAAAIITRGLAEIIRLGIALGAKGHAGRSGRCGRSGGHLHLAAVAQPVLRRTPGPGRVHGGGPAGGDGHVAEGVKSCNSVRALASSHDVEMPLTDAVHRVCHEGLSVTRRWRSAGAQDQTGMMKRRP